VSDLKKSPSETFDVNSALSPILILAKPPDNGTLVGGLAKIEIGERVGPDF